MAKRTYRPTDESIVLERISAGTLRVDTVGGRVFFLKCGTWNECTYYPCHRGYRWVRLQKRGARRAVAVHRAVWIAANGWVPPAGAQVHHIRGKRAGDGIANLDLCLTRADHYAEHEMETFLAS